ncbi:MAG: hypothetical protein FWG90_12495 [Oscillospiraceae bacterium]|nr:hypothetical protein [Oscillospiraceae bacterium]
MYRNNLAYDLSKYEEAVYYEEAQSRPDVDIRVFKPSAAIEGSAPKVIALCAAALAMLGMVVYSKVEHTSLHAEILNCTKQVEILRSENVRMKSEIEGKTSIKAVQDYAENVLGMKKLENAQIQYVGIDGGNTIEIPETNNKIFIKVKNSFYEFIEHIRG